VSLTHQIAEGVSVLLAHTITSPIQILSVCAFALGAGFTVSSSFVKTMVPLRWFGVLSNIGFLTYGILFPNYGMTLMHGILLPINCVRLLEMMRLTRRVRAATRSADRSALWLRPYMKQSKRKKGDVLFRQGDDADHLYILVAGRVEYLENGASSGPGEMFGEIAFFSPERTRTLSARCAEDCVLLSINQSTVRELYYQNPGFGFEIVGLVAGRLSADIARLRAQLRDAQPLS
jgi:CRP/FNR family transcriptional regulator, cyclic AMP receptor protein